MVDDFEILIPGAKELMKRAEKSRVEITVELLFKESNSPLALSVSRELFSVLKRKTTGQARKQLKALAESQGLEAWLWSKSMPQRGPEAPRKV